MGAIRPLGGELKSQPICLGLAVADIEGEALGNIEHAAPDAAEGDPVVAGIMRPDLRTPCASKYEGFKVCLHFRSLPNKAVARVTPPDCLAQHMLLTPLIQLIELMVKEIPVLEIDLLTIISDHPDRDQMDDAACVNEFSVQSNAGHFFDVCSGHIGSMLRFLRKTVHYMLKTLVGAMIFCEFNPIRFKTYLCESDTMQLLDRIKTSTSTELHSYMKQEPKLEALLLRGMQRTLVNEDMSATARPHVLMVGAMALLGGLFLVDKGANIGTGLTLATLALFGFGWAKPYFNQKKLIDEIEEAMLYDISGWIEENSLANDTEYSPGNILALLNLRGDLWTYNRSTLRMKSERLAQVDKDDIAAYNNKIGWYGKFRANKELSLQDFEKRLAAVQAKYA